MRNLALGFATFALHALAQKAVAGEVAVTSPMGDAELLFFQDGSMGVDDGADGTVDHVYATCMGAVPLRCP